MFDELLRTSHRRALHRQVRAERARQCVDAGRHLGSLGCVATRGQMPCRVVGVPSSVQSTRRLRRCRCWRSAIANRSVEGIGEDLEGFWDPAEAEGRRILIGPSIHIDSQRRGWQLSAAGGPTLRPSDSGRSSGPVRDLPPTNRPNGYALRVIFACNF